MTKTAQRKRSGYIALPRLKAKHRRASRAARKARKANR